MTETRKALLLVAHGSRRESSNEEVRTLTRALAEAAGEFDLVDCAFLELSGPDIVTGAEDLIRRGATELTVMPYFLVAGRHVVTDVPAEVERIRRQNPGVPVRITDHLGISDTMITAIMERISSKDSK
ncbi:MAG: CbiX/SirB N-terminal domain-containing protein [Gammaproteobacteria bacterium]|nr:CbiX/SirB N-terminal domain-containing protein [Gammaproteobacteria bacterium]MXY64713.1 cobalamin biosynthesis protein CbiX [Gammaproteobacteria bacterium]MYG65733.1 cobalamin biosynthesis protein CbiX [Gammaproteobacteria bacterium]